VIDDDPCELTIIHGRPKWLAYAAVNLCSITPDEEALARAKEHDRKLAECETQFARAEKAIAGLERQEAAVRDQMVLA
jgi:hypothetical protein